MYSPFARIAAFATVARWLGPWAGTATSPAGIAQHDDILEGDRPIRVRVYHPRGRPRSVYMIAPGLHYAGADDPRQDRFCRVLATAGHLVLAPVLQDFTDLIPTPRVIDDFERVWRVRGRWDPEVRPPVIFSISFGSLASVGLAARVGAGGLARMILFGGYGSFSSTLRYSLTGEVPGRTRKLRDPLNQPVVFMSFVHDLEPPCPDPDAVLDAWREYVRRTWGRPEMKAPERYREVALEIAQRVPESVKQLYLHGIGLTPDWMPFALHCVRRGTEREAALDALPYLPAVRCKVDIMHGINDDVIPYEQAQVLAAGMVHADVRVHLTGLYDHSGGARPSLATAAREAATMLRLIEILANPE
jgi:pimeloyl-ACP methyl ester carboxylesterase